METRFGLFQCYEQRYAVALGCVQRVVDCGVSEALPIVPCGMAGMLVLGDEVIPLVDTGWMPDGRSGRGLDVDLKVLVATEYGIVALPATQTVGTVLSKQCQHQETTCSERFISGEIVYHHFSYLVLDLDALILSLIPPLLEGGPMGAGGIKC